MNVEELVRDALRETAEAQSPAGPGLADRVLATRRRRRRRRIAAAAAATVAVVALGVGIPQLDSGKADVRPAGLLDGSGTSAHPDQSPPRELIGAGEVALAAYYTTELQERLGADSIDRRTYWLLDPGTGRYEKDTRWSFVAVAPGMRTAAVLEQTLPARRIGLLDLATGEVERWIPVRHGVGGLAYSYDGTKLLATTYDEHPDLREGTYNAETGGIGWHEPSGRTARTGFTLVDPVKGTEGPWRELPSEGRPFNFRSDLQFSRDGRLVYSRIVGGRDGMQKFYDLTGAAVAAPADERHLRSDVPARLSPDGKLAALGLTKECRTSRTPRSGTPSPARRSPRCAGTS